MRSRVLIVEDNLDTARLMEKALRLDYDVVACHDAEEAASHLLSGEMFHVVVCDINLPGRDGLSLYEDMKLMGNGFDARFIFSSSAQRSTLEEIGAEYLQKPFRFGELRALVATKIESLALGSDDEDEDAAPSSDDDDDSFDDIHFDGLDI